VRGGQELRPLSHRKHYNFNYQAFDAVPADTATIAPGDSLGTACTFDSRQRNTTTMYGEDSRDEMCYAFVMYYPRCAQGR
jgi:dopamine beta-monooxygenase